MMVGRVPIYLLDTNLEANHPDDRGLMNKLYAGGPELRLRQEWILGVGGVRVLRAMGIEPGVWHANEGHAAFMLVERLRELMAPGRVVSRMRYTRCGHRVCSRRTRRFLRDTTPSPATRSKPARAGLGGDGDRPRHPARSAPIPATARAVSHDGRRDAALGHG